MLVSRRILPARGFYVKNHIKSGIATSVSARTASNARQLALHQTHANSRPNNDKLNGGRGSL